MKKLVFLSLLIFVISGVSTGFTKDADFKKIGTRASHAILIEQKTGAILLEKNADKHMPTSSMSKVMTVYMVFEALKDGRLTLQDRLKVSEKAWKKGGSKMFVGLGETVKVLDLLRGVIVQSGNDATIVLAEGLLGSEDIFAKTMTDQAHSMGMKNSNFKNASGWPDPDHYSTVRDLALLAQIMIEEFPEYYSYFSEKEFTYKNIKQPNRNPLLFRNMGVDGLKTGHTEIAGYGMISSAVRDNRRLVLVVNGLQSEKERGQESARLLEWGFRSFANKKLFKKDQHISDIPVWLGMDKTVPLKIMEDVEITYPKALKDDIKISILFDGPLPAPVKKGDKVAKLKVEIPSFPTQTYDLETGSAMAELGLIQKTWAKAKFKLLGR